MAWDDYQKPSRQKRKQKRAWQRKRKCLTWFTPLADTERSLKNLGSTPANSLQGRIFYAPHSVSRALARLARSLGVSGIRKDPDAPKCVESTPTPFGWFSISKLRRLYA